MSLPADFRSGFRASPGIPAGVAGRPITNHEANAVAYVPNVGFIAAHDSQAVAMLSQDGKAWGAYPTDRVMGEVPMFVDGGYVYGIDTALPKYEWIVRASSLTYPEFENTSLGVTDVTDAVNCWAASPREVMLLEAGGRVTYIPRLEAPVPPAGSPSAPSGLSATGGFMRASLAWTAPSSAGSSAITSYRVEWTATGGRVWAGVTNAGTATTANVTGLANNTEFHFRVAAINASGTGAFSDWSPPVRTSSLPPSAPLSVTATPAGPKVAASVGGVSGSYNSNFTIAWSAPVSTFGAPVTGYVIERVPDGVRFTTNTTATTYTTALTNFLLQGIGKTFQFRVAAVNSAGMGAFSAPSAAVLLK